MKKIIIIVGILLCVFLRGYIYQSTQVLPVEKKVPCVYQAFGDVGQPMGVVSHLGTGVRISARHVINPNYTEDLAIGIHSGQVIGLGENRQNIGNDIGLFELNDVTESGLHLFNERICDTSFDGLITFVSGNLQKIPVELSGTFIDYNPDYGQSGSPIFSGGEIIGIISRKYDGGGVISLVP